MEITSIRFATAKKIASSNGVVGLCSVELDGKLVVHGVKLRKIKNEIKVLLPERRVGSEDKLKSVLTYSSVSFKEKFEEEVLKAYLKTLENHPQGYRM